MIGLLQFALADFNDVRKIFLDLIEKLLANVTFTIEQPVQRILVIVALLLEVPEMLHVRL